jgi:LPS sulfotransferase NodH
MTGASSHSIQRPDILDLIGEEYDRAPTEPARRTLIICAAPRSGSYELCRLLTAAGLGVPHEYFHDQFARSIAARWSIPGDPLAEDMIEMYVDALRRRRATKDLFATKLQFWQFDRFLRNRHGAALFEGACVIHLFRPDVAEQFTSFRKAMITGRWDFSPRSSSTPQPDGLSEALNSLDVLIAEDAGFRRLFALLGINPMFFMADDIGKRPCETVNAIARMLGASINRSGLDEMLATSAPYPQDHKSVPAKFADAFRTRAFQRP